MSGTIDLFEVGTVFATTVNDATLAPTATVRLWRINSFGTPVEITKEKTND